MVHCWLGHPTPFVGTVMSDDVLAVLKSTGAADCGNVEASFAILSARMFPSIPQ